MIELVNCGSTSILKVTFLGDTVYTAFVKKITGGFLNFRFFDGNVLTGGSKGKCRIRTRNAVQVQGAGVGAGAVQIQGAGACCTFYAGVDVLEEMQ